MNQPHPLTSEIGRDIHGSLASSWTGTSVQELGLEDLLFNNAWASHTTGPVRRTDGDGVHGCYMGSLGFGVACDELERRE